MATLNIATDEDIANRAIGDWSLIVPKYQRLSRGVDGSFSSGDAWTLNSATNNFQSQGVAPGHLVIFPKDAQGMNDQAPPVDMLAVGSVSGTAATLRRVGLAALLGSPFAVPGVALANAPFKILTANVQINRATYEVQRAYNLQSSDDLADAEDIRALVVLMVLDVLYFNAAKNLGEQSDDFASKLRIVRSELREVKAMVDGRYGLQGNNPGASAGVMPVSLDAPIICGPYFPTNPYPYY